MKNLSAPIFIKGIAIPDTRGKFQSCYICNQNFNLMHKEHQCKRCRRAVCRKCASNKAIVFEQGQPSPVTHRQCNICKDDQEDIKKFIQQNQIKFNTDTLSIQWLQKYESNPQMASEIYEQAKSKSQGYTSPDLDKFKTQLGIVMQEIDQMQNYSLKDFTYSIISQDIKVRQIIESILGTFLCQIPNVGYAPEIVVITYWLLCFSSEASTYQLLTLIYKNIIPSELYPSQIQLKAYNYQVEVSYLIQFCSGLVKCSDEIIYYFTQKRFYRYLSQLGINLYSFQNSFLIFNQIMMSKNSYIDFLKYWAVTLSQAQTEINKKNFQETELYIFRNIKFQQLANGFNSLDKVTLTSDVLRTESVENQLQISGLSKERSSNISQIQTSDSFDSESGLAKQYLEYNQAMCKLIQVNENLQAIIAKTEAELLKTKLVNEEKDLQIEELETRFNQQQSIINSQKQESKELNQIIDSQASQIIQKDKQIQELQEIIKKMTN